MTPASCPLSVAVTGGIACGKSEVGRILARAGVAVADADRMAREIMAPGTPVFERIRDAWGAEVCAPDGALHRERLARRVFSDPAARERLNAMVHPEVIRRCDAWRRDQQRAGRHAAALVPLLYEAGMQDGWDAVICVTDDEVRVRERLLARGYAPEEAAQRVAAQWPVAEKERRADYVIRNRSGLPELERETLAVWRQILQKGSKDHA